MSRPDAAAAAARTVLVPAAGGTGNALHKTLCERGGERNDVVGTAFLVAKGRPQPLDLWQWVRPAPPPAAADGGEAAAEAEHLCWSFLSLSWGIVSDVRRRALSHTPEE
jgi:hypothetical protein